MDGDVTAEYRVMRDGQEIGRTSVPYWEDKQLKERTIYKYRVCLQN